MTVGSLVAGRQVPLAHMEHVLWNKYRVATERIKQQSTTKKGKR